jgi:hypothetical protein
MAIYPWHSTNIKNVDVLIGSNFQAGMALWTDSNGRAVKADSQQQVFTSVTEKFARFIGFAASDHDLNNTLILPDVIGSNYVDNNNSFVMNNNTEYSVPKRGLLDLQDTAISKFYNPTETSIIAKRGVGVYNTPGDIFITDQFIPVLHGDYGVDGTSFQTINAGDLVTFGGGSNAGKLVKVNVDSFGPDILVIGQVEKYNPSTGLLYFRQNSYRLSFGTASSTVFALDAGSTISYPGSGTVWYDLSGNARNFTLTNGPVYSSDNSGLISFDGTNDFARLTYTVTQSTSTLMFWFNSRSFSTATGLDSIISNDNTGGSVGFDFRKEFGSTSNLQYSDYFNGSWVLRNVGTLANNSWYLVVATYDEVRSKVYLNNALTLDNAYTGPKNTGATIIEIANQPFFGAGGTRSLSCFVSEVRFLNKALTATEVSSYYNSTKGRYGL